MMRTSVYNEGHANGEPATAIQTSFLTQSAKCRHSRMSGSDHVLPEEGLFLGAIGQILNAADEHGQLVRLRYSGPPPEPKQH